MLKEYELTVLLPPKTTSAKKKSFLEKLEKMVSLLKGKITKKEEWGNIELCYPIKKNTSSLFLHFKLELEPQEAKRLRQKLDLEEEILRSLLITRGEKGNGKKSK